MRTPEGDDIARTVSFTQAADGTFRAVPPATPIAAVHDDTTTTLPAAGTFTSTARDAGDGALNRPSRVRWLVNAAAAIGGTVAHLYFEESPDGLTWWPTAQTPLPVDGKPHTGEFGAGHLRYHRLRLVNGTAALSALTITSTVVRGDGASPDGRCNLALPLTPIAGATLAVGAAYTSPVLDLGANHQWNVARVLAVNDGVAVGTVRPQVSIDGATFRAISTLALAAGAFATMELPLGPVRSLRVGYSNDALVASTGVAVAVSLLSL